MTVFMLLLMFVGSLSSATAIAMAVTSLIWVLIVAVRVRGDLLNNVRTLSNLLESTRTQDCNMRGVRARGSGELAELYGQINGFTDNLQKSRQSEQELLSILETVVSQISVAIIVFDSCDKIRLVNQLASTLLKSDAAQLIGTNGADTVLGQLPITAGSELVDFKFPGAEGRWQIRQHYYRQQGQVSRIVFIADFKQVLSNEEIAAWQRLIRVISHEVNNSLTPITSLCQTIAGILAKSDSADSADAREGLGVIGERARGLQDFISSYARLARLPEPQKILFSAADLASSLRHIFVGCSLEISAFPDTTIFGDPVQLEQALINLIKNGLEANAGVPPPVLTSCRVCEGHCEFHIVDHGPGIGNVDNLFVPFYTTKAEGAGIGLILCRQIATKHHGQVRLENRSDARGAVAKLILPLPAPS